MTIRRLAERTWRADSAAEALAELDLEHRLGLTGEVCRTAGKVGIRLPRKRLYRGQLDSRWGVSATLDRITDPRLRERRARATTLFAEVVRHQAAEVRRGDGYQDYPPTSELDGLAAAQHYGMATALTDWTTNLGVATFFSAYRSSWRAPTPPLSAIFWIDLVEAEQAGLKIVIPPPFIRRVHLQRGVFIDTSGDAERLTGILNKMEFPRLEKRPTLARPHPDRPAECAILLKAKHLLLRDAWFERLRKWCNVQAGRKHASSFGPFVDFAIGHGYHEGAHPFADFGFLMVDEYLGFMIELLDQLALRNVARPAGLFYDPMAARLIGRHNPEFFAWLNERYLDAALDARSDDFFRVPLDTVRRVTWFVAAARAAVEPGERIAA